MQRFGDAIVDFKAQVERAQANEAVEVETKANLLEVESEEEAQYTFVQPCESEPEKEEQVKEAMVESCVIEPKKEEKQVQDKLVGQDEMKSEKEKCQRAAIKVNTRSHSARGWSWKVAKEMFRQIEAEESLLLPTVMPVDQWKSKVKSSEGSWEAERAELRLEPG